MVTNPVKKTPSLLIPMDIFTSCLQPVIIMISFTVFMMELHGLSPVSRAVRVLTVGIHIW